MLLSALLLAAQAPSSAIPVPPPIVAATPPVAKYPVQRVVSPDDYPMGAKGRGVVAMNLTIDARGMVIGCQITKSGGSSELDRATCNLMRRRARFVPAMNQTGAPAVGTVAESVDWDAVFRNVRVR